MGKKKRKNARISNVNEKQKKNKTEKITKDVTEKNSKEKSEVKKVEKNPEEKSETKKVEKNSKEKNETKKAEKNSKEKSEAKKVEKNPKEKSETKKAEKNSKEKNETKKIEKKHIKKDVDVKIQKERDDLKENKKNRKKIKRNIVIKKFFIFNFLVGTICCYIGLFVVYGPNTSFRNWFVTTAEASMRHQYYARWFYDEPTISYVMSQNDVVETGESTDTTLYNMDDTLDSGKVTYKNEYERQILERDPAHPDYKILEFKNEKLKSGRVFDGYMAVIYDASKIHTVATKYLGTRGEYLKDMAKRVDAQIAINGGGFIDPNFNSNGATPLGITISNGKTLRSDESYNGAGGIIGFNEDDQLVLAKCSKKQAEYLGIRDCVTFGPFIIVNGQSSKVFGNGGWGIAPRTVIGQRADGIVLFFISDGRSGIKQGIDMNDEIEIMERYEAINAANLDGGTSSVMIEDGEMINDPIDSTGAHKTRWISTGFYLEK